MSIQAFQYPVYQPAMRIISAISKANPVSITTTFAHQYVSGTIVRLDVPQTYGMTQINQQFGPITVTSTTTFTIPIDSTLYTSFVVPGGTIQQYAQSVPIAELALQLTAAVQNVLPYPAS